MPSPYSGMMASYNNTFSLRSPVVSSGKGDSIRIVGADLFDTIGSSSSGSLVTGAIAVNIGLLSRFSYASSIARQYSLFRFLRLKMHYLPFVGTTTPGSIANALAFGLTGPSSSITAISQLVACANSMIGAVYLPQTLEVDCSKFEFPYYQVTTTPINPDEIPLTWLVANVGTSVTSLGYLIFEYEVECCHRLIAALNT